MSVPFEPPPLNNRYRGGRGQGLQRGPFLARYLARCVMITVLAVVAGLLQFPLGMVSAANAADPCAPVVNAIACENSKPGTPVADWDIDGAGDPAIQGFATQMSTNAGNSVDFKIDTSAANYSIAIFRTGWYQGLGARKVADVTPTVLKQVQPQCLTDVTTELYDCGTWGVSATWQVPATAVSGVYVALLTRADTGGKSHITFVVRNDASQSDVVFQTSDASWQAYNTYGGSDFYQGAANGRAYKISYNRPFATRGESAGRDFYFGAEYPLVRFMEKNGYDVSYIASADTDRSGAKLLNHKVFLSVGHDEYWSGAQRANVEAARDAGVHLQFLSGNEVYWRTSFDASPTDGSAHRTITSYKETWANAKIDPSPGWTGTWRDPRFAAPANGGGKPENALTGTAYVSNFTDLPITVNSEEGKTRLWRNTPLANLAAGTSQALAPHTIGYESDEDLDNGFRPAGLIRLSTSTGPTPQYLQDFGNVVQAGTTTHNVTLYRAASGALVFGAGTVQWTWGLDQFHDGDGAPADSRMQQAQVNLFADMGAQARTLDPSLTQTTASTDATGPTSAITSPAEGTTAAHGTSVTVTGTATDVGGQVAGVEVSTDGGTTWRAAEGKQNWTYTYLQKGLATATIKVRATDDSANIGTVATRNLLLTGPYSVFGNQVPTVADSGDGGSYELGLQVTPSVDGFISGARFFKSAANTGTHTGSLWNAAGERLATATFTAETASGWQKVKFPASVPVTAGQKYTISYTAPVGRYAVQSYQWASFGSAQPPLTVAGGFGAQPAGVYGQPGTLPTSNFGGGNYFVDALFETTDNTPLSATTQFPLPGSSSVPQDTTVGATLSKPINTASVVLTLKSSDGATVAGSTTYDAATRKAVFTPVGPLGTATTYSATLSASDTTGGAITAGGNWSFTTVQAAPVAGACPCGLFSDATVPGIQEIKDGTALSLGVRFASVADGTVTGLRFYKTAANTGSHTGYLFSGTGQQLATVTFANESSQGWQSATFGQPVSMSANTEYVVAYKSSTGTYSATVNGFGPGLSVGNLRANSDAGSYSYSADYPGSRSSASYLVDVMVQYPQQPFSAGNQSPLGGSSSAALTSIVSATLSAPATAGSVTLGLKTAAGATIPGTTAYDTVSRKVTFTPDAALPPAGTFTATLAAVSTSGQQVSAGATWTFSTVPEPRVEGTCPCTLYQDTVTPTTAEVADGTALTLGVRFASSSAGTITGIRYYKSAGNTGTHTGYLFTVGGQQLGTVTFANESTAGWQSATFDQPITVAADTEYIAAYTTPTGTYSYTAGGFDTGFTSGPLRTAESSGAFAYPGPFPGATSRASYLVDVVFATAGTPTATPTPTAPPTPTPTPTPTIPAAPPVSVVSQSPAPNATAVSRDVKPSLTVSEALAPGGSLTLLAGSAAVSATTALSADAKTLVVTPAQWLPANTVVTVTASNVVSSAGAALAATTWKFTTANPPNQTLLANRLPAVANSIETRVSELGVSFSASVAGSVTGIRFYKGTRNTGVHVGSLWNATGTRLAQVTFSNETASGWQTAALSTPVQLTPGAKYVVSYTAPVGRFSYTTGFFLTTLTSGNLTAPSGQNGLYRFGAGTTVPTQSSLSTNYFVDVVFSPLK